MSEEELMVIRGRERRECFSVETVRILDGLSDGNAHFVVSMWRSYRKPSSFLVPLPFPPHSTVRAGSSQA